MTVRVDVRLNYSKAGDIIPPNHDTWQRIELTYTRFLKILIFFKNRGIPGGEAPPSGGRGIPPLRGGGSPPGQKKIFKKNFKKIFFGTIALLLKIHGYYYLPEGKKLFLDISNIINKRYSTSSIGNTDERIADIENRYRSILEKDPPFDVQANIPHVDNVREFMKNRSKNPPSAPRPSGGAKTVYIYIQMKVWLKVLLLFHLVLHIKH